MPRLTVFQTFDDAVATYHTFRFAGSTAMSAMRPDMRAGPMPRSWRAERKPVVTAGGVGGDWARRGAKAVHTAASARAAAGAGERVIRILRNRTGVVGGAAEEAR